MTELPGIVPILNSKQIAGVAGPAPQGNVVYHGGHLLTTVEVTPIFWGTAWQQQPQNSLVSSINQFFDYILTSPAIDLLSEYSVDGQVIGRGWRNGSLQITSEPGHIVSGGREIDDSEIQQALQQWIAKGTIPQPNGNTLYYVYLPPGVTSVYGGYRSCQGQCGYHQPIGDTIFYAVVPYPLCDPCSCASLFDNLTLLSSHALCGAITDPILGQGWYDNTNGEIGNVCAKNQTCAQRIQHIAGYTVQAEWSNIAHACIARRSPPVGNLFHSVQAIPNDGFENWESLVPPPVGLGQIAVSSTFTGGLQVFAVDTNGQAWSIWKTGPDGSFIDWWLGLDAPSAALGQIAVGRNSDDTLETFGIDTPFGNLWHTRQFDKTSGFPSWAPLVAPPTGLGQIAVSGTFTGGLQVFAVDTDGQAWSIWKTGPDGNFIDWWLGLGSPPAGLSEIAVGRNSDDTLEAFASDRGVDSFVWHTRQPDKSSGFPDWSTLGDIGGLGQITVGSNGDGRLEGFAVLRK